ncbi:EpsG family protein [Vibrio natriegens]|uniref:EpsG family protein n=1 Tax=Vibrio natriegens TaxID=691 RepID=UPI0009C12B37|nr:EpsG family protein [Vibrio natriegens]
MLPYFLVFSFSLINFILYDEIKRNNKGGQHFFLLLSFLGLIFLSSFRSSSVGTDTGNYLWIWNNTPTNLSDLLDKTTLYSEFGFDFLSYLTKYLSIAFFDDSNIPFLMFISLIVVVLSYSSIIKYSQYKVLSLFCFLMLGFYSFHYNGARQAIAIAIFLFSTRYILSGNVNKYLACLFVGFLFHKSILVCLPFYYFFRQPLTVRMVSLIVFSSCIMAFSIQTLVDYASGFDQRYSGYANSDFEGGGGITVVFNVVMFFWLLFVKKVNELESKLYDIAVLSMLIVSCLGVISVSLNLNPSGILRLTSYFAQFLIFALPLSIHSFKKRRDRLLVMLLSIVFMVYYFYLTTKSFSGLAPYRFNLDSLF